MSEIWYQLSRGYKAGEPICIKAREFERSTEHFLIKSNGSKEGKHSGWHSYHETREAARLYALERAQEELDLARGKVREAEEKVRYIVGLA